MPRRLELRVYDQAKSFADAARLLNAAVSDPYAPGDTKPITPLVVTAAFAIELYFKAVSLAVGKKLHGHDLLKLHRGLSTDVQSKIRSEFVAASNERWGRAMDLARTLEMMKDSFVDWRYPYESAKGLMFKPGVALTLIDALDSVCRSLHEAKGWQ